MSINNVFYFFTKFPAISVLGIFTLFLIINIILNVKCYINFLFVILGLIISFISTVFCINIKKNNFLQEMIIFDNFYIFYSSILLISSTICVIITFPDLKNKFQKFSEFYLFILLSTMGSMILIGANHIVTFLLGITLSSIPLSGMIGYFKKQQLSIEASIKYTILSSIASSFLIFGLALMYFSTGKLYFLEIGSCINNQTCIQPILVISIVMILVSFGCKLSFFPFHLWIPDISQGSSAVVLTFINITHKISVFLLFVRFFFYTHIINISIVFNLLKIITISSILFGNLMALKQENLKRALSYTSISYLGNLMIGLIMLIKNQELSFEAISIALINYSLVNFGIFSIIGIFKKINSNYEEDNITYYKGFFWSHPYISFVLTCMLLNLSGMPLTLGFITKLYTFVLLIQERCYDILISVIFSSILSILYYLYIISIIYNKKELNIKGLYIKHIYYLIPSLILFLIFLFGCFPNTIIKLSQFSYLKI